jgi:hypothetical protein
MDLFGRYVMTFTQQLLATLIGAFGGFCGSLVLFWIKEKLQDRAKETALLKNLSFELDYNINLLSKFDDDLTGCLEKVAADNKSVYANKIDYSLVASFFSIQFYKSGLLPKYVHYESVKRWNEALIDLSPGSEDYFLDLLGKWRKSDITKNRMHNALTSERTQVRNAVNYFRWLKKTIFNT